MGAIVRVVWPGEAAQRRDPAAVTWAGAVTGLEEAADELTVHGLDEDHREVPARRGAGLGRPVRERPARPPRERRSGRAAAEARGGASLRRRAAARQEGRGYSAWLRPKRCGLADQSQQAAPRGRRSGDRDPLRRQDAAAPRQRPRARDAGARGHDRLFARSDRDELCCWPRRSRPSDRSRSHRVPFTARDPRTEHTLQASSFRTERRGDPRIARGIEARSPPDPRRPPGGRPFRVAGSGRMGLYSRVARGGRWASSSCRSCRPFGPSRAAR